MLGQSFESYNWFWNSPQWWYWLVDRRRAPNAGPYEYWPDGPVLLTSKDAFWRDYYNRQRGGAYGTVRRWLWVPGEFRFDRQGRWIEDTRTTNQFAQNIQRGDYFV